MPHLSPVMTECFLNIHVTRRGLLNVMDQVIHTIVCIQHLLRIEIKRRLSDCVVFLTEEEMVYAGYKSCLAQKRLEHLW